MLNHTFRAKRSAVAFAVFGVLVAGLSAVAWAESSLTARAVSAAGIGLEWPGGMPVSIERRTGDGAFEAVAVLDADRHAYLDRGLAEGTAYTYRLLAKVGARYDFGPAGSPADGHVRVKLADRYTPKKAYGLVPDAAAPPGGERNRGGRAEPGLATLVYQSPKLTFAKDLPDGEFSYTMQSVRGAVSRRPKVRRSPFPTFESKENCCEHEKNPT